MGQLVFQATLGGQVALVGPNTASTININIPATNGNMVTTGDTGTVTNTMLASSAYAIPGTIGSTTPNSGAFTTLSASSTVSGTGFSTYLASPPAIGGTAANTGSFTTLTTSSTVTLNGGTANGVLYLNGSKVATSGSALTFDGTHLLVGTTTSNGAMVEAAVSASASYQLAANFTNSTNANFQIKIANSISGIGTSTNTPLAFLINSTEIMRADTSGNLGLGVTPSAWGGSRLAFEMGSGSLIYPATNAVFQMAQNAYYAAGGWTYKASTNASIYAQDTGKHVWYTAPSGTAGNAISFTQAMTLDIFGNFLVGQTSTAASQSGHTVVLNGTATALNTSHASGTGSGAAYHSFYYNATGIGSITQNGTTGVLYNIVSDYRLKDVVGSISDSGSRIDAVQPINYTMKADGSTHRGFLAHQFQEVYPNSVSGEKDAVDEKGEPILQGMQASSAEAMADIFAELQSLRKRVAQLEGK